MTDLPAGPRRYDEKEVSLLLKRASELQRSLPTSPNPTGLTLAELEEIAGEAGLDPALLRRAANEMDRGEVGGGGWAAVTGAPTRLLLERRLPFTVPETAFGRLVPSIQIAADSPGQASQVGHSLTWHSQNPSNPRVLQILVSVQNGETLIRIEERYGGLAGALFGGVVGGGGVGVGVGVGGTVGGLLGSAALAVAFPVALIGGSYMACRALFRSIVRKRGRVLQELLDTLAGQLGEMAGAQPPPPGTLPPSPPD